MEKRGDFNTRTALEILKQTAPLDEVQTAAARQEAKSMYQKVNQQPHKPGLAPFQDGRPDDMLAFSQRLLAFQVNP